ncbi:signal peptidase I [Candidatus Woesearchaeota archaeon]|nr:signal peptidase I [Candidatus Woesearchaeota archaeon]
MNKKQVIKFLKDAWYFIWESNSIWSWIVNIILAFVIIKFLVYPGLGFLLSTSHPIVAVVSSSMEHDGSFDQWWSSKAMCDSTVCTQKEFYSDIDITKQQFLTFKFKNGFNKGDIMLLKGTSPEKINIGDVIVFQNKRPDPIIHRVIKKRKENGIYYFQTKGDHNSKSVNSTLLDETKIPQNKVIGKASFRVPYLGWIKIAFVGLLKLIGIVK